LISSIRKTKVETASFVIDAIIFAVVLKEAAKSKHIHRFKVLPVAQQVVWSIKLSIVAASSNSNKVTIPWLLFEDIFNAIKLKANDLIINSI